MEIDGCHYTWPAALQLDSLNKMDMVVGKTLNKRKHSVKKILVPVAGSWQRRICDYIQKGWLRLSDVAVRITFPASQTACKSRR